MSLRLQWGCTAVLFLLALSIAPIAHAQKKIYLTFDMDMNEVMYTKTLNTKEKWYDPALFTYLKQQNIPATFFVSGLFAIAYPNLIEKLASSSDFSFQNHSYDESSFVPDCYWLATLQSTQQKMVQIGQTEAIINRETAQEATYFRFPGICHDSENDALVENLGYEINDGSVISGDPFTTNTQAIVSRVLTGAHDGATVIMHVGGPNAPESLAALEQIIPSLKAEGYAFAKL